MVALTHSLTHSLMAEGLKLPKGTEASGGLLL